MLARLPFCFALFYLQIYKVEEKYQEQVDRMLCYVHVDMWTMVCVPSGHTYK